MRIDNIETNSYDANGNMVEHKFCNDSKNINSCVKFSWKYTYDEKSNWTMKTEYKNEIVLNIFERAYTYYD